MIIWETDYLIPWINSNGVELRNRKASYLYRHWGLQGAAQYINTNFDVTVRDVQTQVREQGGCQDLLQGFIIPVVSRDLNISSWWLSFNLLICFSICKMKIICCILSHKAIEVCMKIFQALWLKDIKYIEIHILTAMFGLNNMFPFFFFNLGCRVRGDNVVSNFSHSV